MVAVTPDGQQAISASLDHTLKVWDLEYGRELLTLRGHTDRVTGIAVTPDGRWVISSSSDRSLKVWDLEQGVVMATFSGETPLQVCAFGPDGKTIIVGEQTGQVHFLRLEEEQQHHLRS